MPIPINGYNGDTFSGALKNKGNNAVNFIAFASSTEKPIADNPFSFTVGYVMVFHAGLINSPNIFTLIGISATIEPKIETKRINLNS